MAKRSSLNLPALDILTKHMKFLFKPIWPLVLCLLLVACSSGNIKNQREIQSLTAEEIVALGNKQLTEDNNPLGAAKTFSEVERIYPYSGLAKTALILQAFAFYQAKDYEQAIASAENYINFYPAGEEVDRALFIIAESHYDQLNDKGLDRAFAEQTLRAMQSLLSEFPDSEYAKSAAQKRLLVYDLLAYKEIDVGRFYLKKQNYFAAIGRFRHLIENYPQSSYIPEALHRLVEAYLTVGLQKEAQTAAAILGYNFTDNEWYSRSYRLLQQRNIPPSPESTGWLRDIYDQLVLGKWF